MSEKNQAEVASENLAKIYSDWLRKLSFDDTKKLHELLVKVKAKEKMIQEIRENKVGITPSHLTYGLTKAELNQLAKLVDTSKE